ncbi:unnamed protein product [Nyctereutes procyonoides]|uniref:(raccoon dog) hypothetical protein n=1 Tax=Nyctereutes procyonoides TaxID=34880 RepID=A0A811YWC7_NYCPR|nr:unnamed protein product [Nyctereutes procyonoides]
MKFDPFVTSDQSKNHKIYFNVPSCIHRKIMSFPLSKELRQNTARKVTDITVHVGIHPNKVVITRLHLDKDHKKKILEGKTKSHQVGKEEGKYKEETIEKMQE